MGHLFRVTITWPNESEEWLYCYEKKKSEIETAMRQLNEGRFLPGNRAMLDISCPVKGKSLTLTLEPGCILHAEER